MSQPHQPWWNSLIDFVNKSSYKKTVKGSRQYGVAAFEIARREVEARRTVASEVRELGKEDRYGFIPREKPDDVYRLMFENWNSLGVFTGTSKISKLDRIAKHYEVDTMAGCEAQCDWRYAEYEQQFRNLFAFGKRTKSVVGHNITERTVRDQKGGTAMMTFGRMTSHVMDSVVGPGNSLERARQQHGWWYCTTLANLARTAKDTQSLNNTSDTSRQKATSAPLAQSYMSKWSHN